MHVHTPPSKREIFELGLLRKAGMEIEILEPGSHKPLFLHYKLLADSPHGPRYGSSYGFGLAASALYCNGFNPRGQSYVAPFGFVYSNDSTLFSFGYFRKPGSREEDDGYMVVLHPIDRYRHTGELVNLEPVVRFIRERVFSRPDIPCAGAYIRFLRADERESLMKLGLQDVDAHPWSPNAPMEDETFHHAIINLPEVVELSGNSFNVLDLHGKQDKDHRRKSRMAFQRFANFCLRSKTEFRMEKMKPDDSETAMRIIRMHFASSKSNCHSVPEDYLGLTDPRVLQLPDIYAYIGYLNDVPVSAFIGEKISRTAVGLYSSITLHNNEFVLPQLGIDPEDPAARGFSSLSLFSQFHYFAKLLADGITLVNLGGSETKALDDAKRQMGAREDNTSWLFMPK